MRSNTLRPLWAILFVLAAACSSDNGSEECDVGESCECSADTDCPNPLLERCAPESGTCVPRDGGSDTGDAGFDTSDSGVDSGREVDEPGACTNPPDLEIISRNDGGALRICGVECFGGEDAVACASQCFDDLGLSGACASCHTEAIGCEFGTCAAECTARGPEQAETEECGECVTANCEPAFTTCTGSWVRGVSECRSPADTSVLEQSDVSTIAERVASCDRDCANSDWENCTVECVSAATDVSEFCSACFVQRAACTEVECAIDCEDTGSVRCGECREEACLEQLATCTGLPYWEDPTVDPGDAGTVDGGLTDAGIDVGPDLPGGDRAWVHFVHLSPDTRALTFYAGSANLVGASEGFGRGSGLAPVEQRDQELLVMESDRTPPDAPLITVRPDQPLGVDEVFTLGVYGESAGSPVSLAAVLLVEEAPEVDDGMSWRVFNASSAGSSVSVFDATEVDAASPLAVGLAFGSASERSVRADTEALVLGVDTTGDEAIDHEFTVGPFDAGSHVTFWVTSNPADEVTIYVSTRTGSLLLADRGR